MHSIRGFALFVDPQRTCRPVGRELRLRCSWNRTLGVPLPKTDLWPGSRHFFLCTWGDRSIGLEAHEMGFSSTLSGKGRRLMQYCHSAYTAILILRNILLHVPLNYEELWSQILSYYLSRRHRSYTFFFLLFLITPVHTRYSHDMHRDYWKIYGSPISTFALCLLLSFCAFLHLRQTARTTGDDWPGKNSIEIGAPLVDLFENPIFLRELQNPCSMLPCFPS